jgi:hypothetical protein
MIRSILALGSLAVVAPAFALEWHSPQIGFAYSIPSFGKMTRAAHDLATVDALNLPQGPATLTFDSEQTWKGSDPWGLILSYELTPHLTIEANYFGNMLGGGVDFAAVEGTSIYTGGTARQHGQVITMGSALTVDQHWYGGALLGYWPIWRGLHVLARAGIEHTRTEVTHFVALGGEKCTYTDPAGRETTYFCGLDHTGSSAGAARNVPQVGLGLSYRWRDWGSVSVEYDRTLTDLGDARTGRYSLSTINFQLSVLLSAIGRH